MTIDAATIDAGTIAESLHHFFDDEDAFEVRFLGTGNNSKSTKSIFLKGRDIDRLSGRLDSEVKSATKGVHFTPQGIDPRILRERGNCVLTWAKWDKVKKVSTPKLTHDEDVPHRRLLIVDVDPVRAKGFEGDSASREERVAAWNVAEASREFLRSNGWADPLIVSSGNGFHCYYRLAEQLAGGPTDPINDPLAILLKLLGQKFGTARAEIDDGMYTAGHLLKVPGTPSRKGPNTEERPHRLSKVVEVPETWSGQAGCTPTQRTVAEVIELLDPNGVIRAGWKKNAERLAEFSIACRSESHALYRASRYLAKLPAAVSGKRGHNDTYRAAAAMAWRFALDEQVALDMLMAEYNPRCEPAWSEGQMRRKVCEALTKPHREPRGYLLNQQRQETATTQHELDASVVALLDSLCKPKSNTTASEPDIGLSNSGPVEKPKADAVRLPTGMTEPKKGESRYLAHAGEVDNPTKLAYGFLEMRNLDHLRCHQELIDWKDGAYHIVHLADIEADLRRWMNFIFERDQQEKHKEWSKTKKDDSDAGEPKCKPVTDNLVKNVVSELKSIRHISREAQAPCWIDGQPGPNPRNIIPVRNGLYDFEGNQLLKHDPSYFNYSVVPFDYVPDPPDPKVWLTFLDQVWGKDPDNIACLQEWFGYMLTQDTSQQKFLYLYGVPRSGKGTITTVLKDLVGERNCTGFSVNKLAEPHGLFKLVGKTLALASDLKLSNRVDKAMVIENLLKITGEGEVDINPKHRDEFSCKLTCRFVVCSNERFNLEDGTGALEARIILLRMTESFIGREDKALSDKLKAELPGIFKWSLDGLRRLRTRGKFDEPATGQAITRETRDANSPVSAFVRDACVRDPHEYVIKDVLFDGWMVYRAENGYGGPDSKEGFFKKLGDIVTTAKATKKMINGKREPIYSGITLKERSTAGLPFEMSGLSEVSGVKTCDHEAKPLVESVSTGSQASVRDTQGSNPDTPDSPDTPWQPASFEL